MDVDGRKIDVVQARLKKRDLDSYTLSFETSATVDLINSLFESKVSVKGRTLCCLYDGEEVNATLEIMVRHEIDFFRHTHVLTFLCSSIESDEKAGDIYEFVVPFSCFRRGDHLSTIESRTGTHKVPDHIRLQVDGVEWSFRQLYEVNGSLYPFEQAVRVRERAAEADYSIELSSHSVLQVPIAVIDRSSAECVATDICWLLHLAFAQRVAWSELRIRTGDDVQFLCRRPFSLASEMSVSRPIINEQSGEIRRFIESAFPKFRENPEWWRVSLNWFSIAGENASIESCSMIFCMLFDRASSYVLKGRTFPRQISIELEQSLASEEKRAELVREISDLMQRYSGKGKWSPTHSMSLVEKVKEWNDSLSYPRKISTAFELLGIESPPKDLLKKRHKLVHHGELQLGNEQAGSFLFDLRYYTTLLLMSLLDYWEDFYSPGYGRVDRISSRSSSWSVEGR